MKNLKIPDSIYSTMTSGHGTTGEVENVSFLFFHPLLFQNKLDFDLEDLGDTEEMAHVKELQMRAEKYLKLVLRVWRYGLKSSRDREDERDWKNLVFCLKYTIYILTLDLGKLVGVTDTYEKV